MQARDASLRYVRCSIWQPHLLSSNKYPSKGCWLDCLYRLSRPPKKRNDRALQTSSRPGCFSPSGTTITLNSHHGLPKAEAPVSRGLGRTLSMFCSCRPLVGTQALVRRCRQHEYAEDIHMRPSICNWNFGLKLSSSCRHQISSLSTLLCLPYGGGICRHATS